MRYFIIAGEASGDIHAAGLMNRIKAHDSSARFVFLGGDRMTEAAGHPPVVHIRDMAFMGFSEVIRNFNKVFENLTSAKHALRLAHPHCLILVDYPRFNLKIAKEARRLGIRTFYYISPKVWAWKEWRVPAIKRLVEKMYVIFPFEVDFYGQRHDWSVEYVGNPSVSEIDERLASLPSRDEFARNHHLPSRQWIALLPGSRVGEIRNNLRVMLEAAHAFPQYRPVIASAPDIAPELYDAIAPGVERIADRSIELLAMSRGALVTSGTATLEAALTGTPQVACYRANGSRISYELMKRLLKVDYVTLPNLIVGRRVIPEMLLHECSPEAVADQLGKIIGEGPGRRAMLEGYAEMRRRLGEKNAPEQTAADIVARLQQ